MEKLKALINTKTLIYTILILLGMGLFIHLDCKNITAHYDDAYSIFLSKASYSDIWSVTASDVHPPLYYWGLKAFTSLFGDSLFSFRCFSTLGLLAVILLGCFPVRKLFGHRVAISFILLIIIFPVSQYLATEIRMYSWTMFFVLASALSAFQVYRIGKMQYWLLFLFTGLCAAYLHNYGLLSLFGIYLILLVFLIKEKKQWKGIFLWGILFLLIYLPWLIQLISQIGMISEDYWIKPLTVNDLFLHIYYFYSPKEIWLPFTDFSKVQMIIGLIIIMLIQLFLTLAALITSLRSKEKSSDYIILSFIIFLIPVTIGALISVTYLPVLVTRYMTCSFGLFVLGLAMVLAKSFDKYKWLTMLFFLLLLVDSGIRISSGLKYYSQTGTAYKEIRDFAIKAPPFVVNDFSYHVMPRLQLIAPGNHYQVLVSDTTDADFRPFVFDKINSLPAGEFILVHQEREAVQQDFYHFWQTVGSQYIITDSLHASDIYLYRIRLKE